MLLLIPPGCCWTSLLPEHTRQLMYSLLPMKITMSFSRELHRRLLHWVLPSQGFPFVFAEFHTVPIGSFLQAIKVPLDSSPAPRLIDSSPQFGVVYKLYKQAFHCLLQVIKMLSRSGPKIDLCSTPLVIGLQAEYDPLTTPLWVQSSNFFFF